MDVSSNISDKHDDFNFDILKYFLLLNSDVPHRASYDIYILQHRVCNDVNARN